MPAQIYNLVIERKPNTYDVNTRMGRYGEDLLDFFETIVTEFPVTLRKWNALFGSDPLPALPADWNASNSAGLIPSWVYSMGANSDTFGVYGRVIGSVEFHVGGTDFCFVIAAINDLSVIGMLLYYKNSLISNKNALKYFQESDEFHAGSTMLEPGDLLYLTVVEKANYYFGFRVFGSNVASAGSSSAILAFRFENTVAPDDTNCWCICGSFVGGKPAFVNRYGTETFTTSGSYISVSRIGDAEPTEFRYNRYTGKVPLWPIVGGTIYSGLRGWTNNILGVPASFPVQEQVYQIDDEFYFGLSNIINAPIGSNGKVFIKL